MISIVFITCNRIEELINAIMSCIDRVVEDFEIIVIDNNSTDQTYAKCHDLSKKFNFNLRYHLNTTNKGVGSSRNIGFELAKGDIVYFLDDDAIIRSPTKCITEVAEFMRAHPSYPVVATEIYNVTENNYQYGAFPVKNKKRSKGEVFNFIGASHFINKGVLKFNKLYPEEFVYGGEEFYLCFLLHSAGYQVFYYNEMLVDHFPSSATRLPADEILISKYSNFFNVKRYYSPFLFMPVIWIVMFIRMILKCYNKPNLFRKFFQQINCTYNKEYRSPMKLLKFIDLITFFGMRIIL